MRLVRRGVSAFEVPTYRQTWAVVAGRFLPDGVWWFFLFWAPAYVHDVYGYSSDSTTGMLLIFTLYLISMLSIVGGYLPTWFVGHKGMNPYAGRMRAMLIYAFFPLIGLGGPLGSWSWFPIVIIGIIGAAHQSWSANVYSVVGDMFPKSAVATVTGIWWYVGRYRLFAVQHVFRYVVYLFQGNADGVFRLPRYRSRLYDSIYGGVVRVSVELGHHQTLGAALPVD